MTRRPPPEDGALRAAMDAMRATREWQVGMAFGVPEDARESFAEALARAALGETVSEVAAVPEIEVIPELLSTTSFDRDQEVDHAVAAAVSRDQLPGGVDVELLRRAYFAAPPRGDGQHIGLEAVAHLVAARLLAPPEGQT